MKIWFIEDISSLHYRPVAAVDFYHLPDAIKRCERLPDLEVDLNNPIELNAIDAILDAERKARRRADDL